MARPKGSGGRSIYDRYRKFGRRRKTTRRNAQGQFTKGRANSRFDKGHYAKKKRSRFSK